MSCEDKTILFQPDNKPGSKQVRITAEELSKIIRNEIQDYFDSEPPFVVALEKHYLHHQQMEECMENRDEWRDNHRFVSGIRSDMSDVKRTFIKRVAVWAALLLTGSISLSWLAKQLGFKFGG